MDNTSYQPASKPTTTKPKKALKLFRVGGAVAIMPALPWEDDDTDLIRAAIKEGEWGRVESKNTL